MLGMEFLKASWIPLLLLILPLLFRMLKQSRAASLKLPPGPTPFPIIGNLHLISTLPHRSLCSLSHKYGPIMTLYLGSLPTIVISSPEMAKQVLKTQDHMFASRPVMGDDNHILSPHKIATAEYGPYWKLMRKMFVQELLSPKKMDSFASLRAREVCAMTHSILETAIRNEKAGASGSGGSMQTVDVTKEVTYFTGNIVSTMTFGRKCYETHLGGRPFKQLLDEVVALLTGFHYKDFIPLLGWLDLHGLGRRQSELTHIFNGYFERIVDEHLSERKKMETGEGDFVDALLSLSEDESMEIKITRDHIKNIIFDIDTSGNILEWAMSELLRNPLAMKRVQEELDSVVGYNRVVIECDLPHLKYLQMAVKETLRLYPSGPLLLPHQSKKHCKIAGYEIPKNTRVLINAWAIGRDPITWEEPNVFKPERFLASKIDVKGQDFELIPFGSGRRICPGINLALCMIQLGLAKLLHCFNWSLPEGISPKNLDMSEAFGNTMTRVVHLHAIPIPRLPFHLLHPKP
ncbi:hypothetical protein KI387_016517 [Taxus chinensis]|uniref:Cytochrome P450 n=1 Tax=Taxus chinensis TaxID=29808 RepID=A0AA38GHD4_TAXCH|nr:hypothetical protein KI387_016517 [Taxus chinensis]